MRIVHQDSDVYKDSKEHVYACLHCTRADCIDCFSGKRDGTYDDIVIDMKHLNTDEKLLVEYYLEGYQDDDLASVVGTTVEEIKLMRKKLGLKALSGKTREIRKGIADGLRRA